MPLQSMGISLECNQQQQHISFKDQQRSTVAGKISRIFEKGRKNPRIVKTFALRRFAGLLSQKAPFSYSLSCSIRVEKRTPYTLVNYCGKSATEPTYSKHFLVFITDRLSVIVEVYVYTVCAIRVCVILLWHELKMVIGCLPPSSLLIKVRLSFESWWFNSLRVSIPIT